MSTCKCTEEIKDREKRIEEESFAMTLLKECSKMARRWFFISMVILVMWLSTIIGFVWYINQYDYASYTISTDGGGDANMIQHGGEILNGKN